LIKTFEKRNSLTRAWNFYSLDQFAESAQKGADQTLPIQQITHKQVFLINLHDFLR
jgi:hypothetical protein